MSTTVESRTELKRLQLALEALSEDLDVMERFPHLSLRVAAENLEPSKSCVLNSFVDQFAVAMKRSTSPNTGSETEPYPIETAPRDGRFLILKEDASGKFNIARWAPEAGGWVRENDQHIKITPAYWYPIQEQIDFQPGLDISTSPCEPEGRAAPQRQLASDVLASRSDAASPDTIIAAKMGPPAVEPKRASARNRFAASSLVALVVAICVGMYFRAEVTSYVARHTVGGDLFGISRVSGEMFGQVTQWLSRNWENQVSPALMSQSQQARQVDASAPQIAGLQHQAEMGGVGAQVSGTTPAKSATLLESAAIDIEHNPALSAERDRAATLANELAMIRRDVETKAALLSRAIGEVAQLKQTAEATARELRQSLVQERDRVAALARDLATTRRDLETEVALSSKAGEELAQLRQAEKAATADLEQERNRSAELARDHESAQRVTGAHSLTERPAGSQIDTIKQVAERTGESPRTTQQDRPDAARLMARASALLAQGSIGAARIVLDRAAETGSAEANFMLAETYDPIVLSKWGTYGTRGEPAKARELYTKAEVGGIPEAKDRLDALRP